ncbi:MAG: PEP/pyruvate-binding domain-containing protein [Chlamydiales bacterium]
MIFTRSSPLLTVQSGLSHSLGTDADTSHTIPTSNPTCTEGSSCEAKPTLRGMLAFLQDQTLSPSHLQHAIKQYQCHVLRSPDLASHRNLCTLLAFMQKNKAVLSNPIVQDFLVWQFARERLNPPKEQKEKMVALFYLYAILSTEDLPQRLRSVLWLLQNEIGLGQFTRPEIRNLLFQGPSKTRFAIGSTSADLRGFIDEGRMNWSIEAKMASIDVSFLLDGEEHRDQSLRNLLHRTSSQMPLTIIRKQLQAFQSGKRTFVFENRESVPIKNYQMVMLYIINSLEEDRNAFYASHSGYIDESRLQEYSDKRKQDYFSSERYEHKYVFEWAARRIVSLRQEVENATGHDQLNKIIDKFLRVYMELPTDVTISLCSCIDTKVFYNAAAAQGYKPVFHVGVPQELIKFAKSFGISSTSNSTFSNMLSHFNRISDYADLPSPFARELVRQLQDAYSRLVLSKDREAMQQFLQICSQIPSSCRSSEGNEHFNRLIQDVERQLVGFNFEDFEQLKKIKTGTTEGNSEIDLSSFSFSAMAPSREQILKNQTMTALNEVVKKLLRKYAGPLASRCQDLNEKEKLIELKNLLEQLIKNPEYASLTDHWVFAYTAHLQQMLSTEPSMSYQPSIHLDLDPVRSKALQEMIGNILQKIRTHIPEILDRVQGVMQLLQSPQERNTQFFIQASDSLMNLKSAVKQYLIPQIFLGSTARANQTACEIVKLFKLIDECLHVIVEEISNDPMFNSADELHLLARIAQSLSYLEELPPDAESLERALEEIEKDYVWLHQATEKHFANLPHLHHAPTLVAQLQGFCNSEIGTHLSKLTAKTQMGLGGYFTQPAEVVGRLRFISSQTDLSSIEEGDILMVQCLPLSGYNHYAKAAAILCEQGGIFSHAAILFQEMGIPALTKTPIDALREHHGRLVYLNISDSSSLSPLSPEEASIFANSHQLTLETAASIEGLSGPVKQAVAQQFYSRLFATVSPAEYETFLVYPSAEGYLKAQKEAIGSIKRALCAAEDPVQRTYLLAKLIFLQKFLSLEETVQLNAEIALMNIQPVQNRFMQQSGKLENLEQVKPVIASRASSDAITVEIPAYISFKAMDLIWMKNPVILEQIRGILHSSAEISQKSADIKGLIDQLVIDEETVLSQWNRTTPWIVRSSSRLEDQAGSSAAGIFDSIPGNERGSIVPAIRRVLASGFSEKALSYRTGQTSLEQLFEMQFILQDYIAGAKFSGVAFSVKDGHQWPVASLQVVEGVGGGVDGKQTPSYFSVDTRENLCIKIDSERLPCRVDTAKAVANLVKDLESYFGTAVEIEFAGDGNQIFLLQVRAITRFSKG